MGDMTVPQLIRFPAGTTPTPFDSVVIPKSRVCTSETRDLACIDSCRGSMANSPSIRKRMDLARHIRITGGALKNWLLAQILDSLAVGFIWLIGLHLLRIPLAPLWAVLAALLQFIPHLGPVLGMLGPVLTAAIAWTDWKHPLYVLMLYAGVVVLDGFVLQPYLLKRTAKVPVWASILAPIVLGFLIPFWGVLLASPLLAVIYAYKARQHSSETS